MRAINITFQHGHIYNSDTKERILVEEGTNYILIFQNESDIKSVKFESLNNYKSGDEIYQQLLKDEFVTHIKKIKEKGEYLYFFIRTDNENSESNVKSTKQSYFRIRLLEDLFLYTSNNWKSKEQTNDGRLMDCACVVDKSENQRMPFFEEITAKSITSVVKKTHIHYFGNAGSPSKNSFDSVFTKPNLSKSSLLEDLRGFSDEDKVVRKK